MLQESSEGFGEDQLQAEAGDPENHSITSSSV